MTGCERAGANLAQPSELGAGLSASDRVVDSPRETLQSGDRVQLAVTTPLAKEAAARLSPAKAD